MPPERLVAFVGFAAVLAITPGPGNALLTATGASVGLLRGLPAVVGFAVGMALLMFVVSFGIGTIILANSLIMTIVKWSGAAVICWLAWSIATAHGSSADQTARPIGFLVGAGFQAINPKAWLAVTSGAATFLDLNHGSAYLQSVTLALIFAAVTLPCCFGWLAFGAAVQRTLRSERALRAFHVMMGVVLASTVVLFLV